MMVFIFSFIKRLLKICLYLTIFAAIIILIPNLPPYTKFTSIETDPIQPGVGPLAPNGALNNAERLYTGKLLGPEAFQLLDGELYTSLATGEIVKISPAGHVTFVTKIGQPCTGLAQEHICGRPLGFQIDEKNKLLYVADAYHGIWKVDLKTDKKQLLVSPQVEIEGRKPKLFNFVVVDKKGELYWTDSSSDFHLKDGALSFLSDPSGRLFHYNTAKNVSEVLLDNLWFPNGIALSPDNDFLVVVESFQSKLLKYYINGPKKGTSEVFVAGLPGTPDNVRALPDGSGVLTALYCVFDAEDPMLTRSMAKTPLVRKFLARLQRLLEIPFEFLHTLYPNSVFEDIVYYIGSFKSLSSFTPIKSGLVQLDWNGNIVASYFNTDGSLRHISDAIVYNDKLYMGNPHVQNFIGAVPAPSLLKKAFSSNILYKSPESGEKIRQHAEETSKQKPQSPKVAKVVVQDPSVNTAKPNKETSNIDPPSVENIKKSREQDNEKQKIPSKYPEVKLATAKQPEAKQDVPKQPEVKTAIPKQPEVKPSTPQQPKVKPATPQESGTKPVTPKQPEAKPIAPKQPEAKPAAPKQPEAKPAAPKQPEAKPATSKESKVTQSKPEQNNVQSTSDSKKVKTEAKLNKKDSSDSESDKLVPEQIPIKEEIPSDTVKPNKERLKVIKKDGPTEIPNPNL